MMKFAQGSSIQFPPQLFLPHGDKLGYDLAVKFTSNCFRTLLLVLALLLVTARAGAQTIGLFAVPSTSTIEVSNSLTYTIDVTNDNTFDETVWVTNTFTGALPINFTMSSGQGTTTTTTNTLTFFLGDVLAN